MPLTPTQEEDRLVLTAPTAPTPNEINEQVKKLFNGVLSMPTGRPARTT